LIFRYRATTPGIQASDTLSGDINPSAQLMQTQTERKIAEEQREACQIQRADWSSRAEARRV